MERPNDLTSIYLSSVYRALEEPAGRWHEFTFQRDAPPGTPGDDPSRLPFAQPWVIVTAWNPMSERLPEADNRAAHARLADAVRGLELAFHPAEGRDPRDRSEWLEESLLIEGLEWKPAAQLLRVFRQRAAVFVASGRAGLLFAEPERWEVHPLRIMTLR